MMKILVSRQIVLVEDAPPNRFKKIMVVAMRKLIVLLLLQVVVAVDKLPEPFVKAAVEVGVHVPV